MKRSLLCALICFACLFLIGASSDAQSKKAVSTKRMKKVLKALEKEKWVDRSGVRSWLLKNIWKKKYTPLMETKTAGQEHVNRWLTNQKQQNYQKLRRQMLQLGQMFPAVANSKSNPDSGNANEQAKPILDESFLREAQNALDEQKLKLEEEKQELDDMDISGPALEASREYIKSKEKELEDYQKELDNLKQNPESSSAQSLLEDMKKAYEEAIQQLNEQKDELQSDIPEQRKKLEQLEKARQTIESLKKQIEDFQKASEKYQKEKAEGKSDKPSQSFNDELQEAIDKEMNDIESELASLNPENAQDQKRRDELEEKKKGLDELQKDLDAAKKEAENSSSEPSGSEPGEDGENSGETPGESEQSSGKAKPEVAADTRAGDLNGFANADKSNLKQFYNSLSGWNYRPFNDRYSGTVKVEETPDSVEDWQQMGSNMPSHDDESNPLLKLWFDSYFAFHIDPFLSSNKISWPKFSGLKVDAEPYSKLMDLEVARSRDLEDNLANIQKLFYQGNANSFLELQKTFEYLDAYSTIWPHPSLDRLKNSVGLLLAKSSKVSVRDADELQQFDQFFSSLPKLGRNYLRRHFGFYGQESQSDRDKAAFALKSRELINLEFVSYMHDKVVFSLLSQLRTPQSKRVPSWVLDTKKRYGEDLVTLERYSELPRAIKTMPHLSLEENIERDALLIGKHRQSGEVAVTKAKENEPGSLTVIAVDVSGSMSHGIDRFQGALTTALTMELMSKNGPGGSLKNSVVVLPFDKEVREPIWIKKPSDLYRLIDNYPEMLQAGVGETNIQSVLLKAFSLIGAGSDSAKKSFYKANLILMSDGLSKLEVDELIEAQSDVKVPFRFGFVNFRTENPILKAIATDRNDAIRSDSESYTFIGIAAIRQAFEDLKNDEQGKVIDSGFDIDADISLSDWSKLQSDLREMNNWHKQLWRSCHANQDWEQMLGSGKKITNRSDIIDNHLQEFLRYLHLQKATLVTKKDLILLGCFEHKLIYLLRQHIKFHGKLSALAAKEAREVKVILRKISKAIEESTEDDEKRSFNTYQKSMGVDQSEIDSWLKSSNDKSRISVPKFGEFSFGLFPGDFRKTCEKCTIGPEGTLECTCREGLDHSETKKTYLRHATDCRSTLENSGGTLMCLPNGDYTWKCENCYVDDGYMRCLCDGVSKGISYPVNCLQLDYVNGELKCMKSKIDAEASD